eukprot:6138416-Pleurochrysis_carterae.AAC.1
MKTCANRGRCIRWCRELAKRWRPFKPVCEEANACFVSREKASRKLGFRNARNEDASATRVTKTELSVRPAPENKVAAAQLSRCFFKAGVCGGIGEGREVETAHMMASVDFVGEVWALTQAEWLPAREVAVRTRAERA